MKMLKLFGLILSLSALAFAAKNLRVRGETLSTKQVAKRWGETQFDEARFRAGSIVQRAEMAASLLQKKSLFLGVGRGAIRERLGDFSGFYISGMYPTYLIHDSKTVGEDSWQLVFLIDSAETVRDIVVQKNCCYAD